MRQRELLVAHVTRLQAITRGVLVRQKIDIIRKRRAAAAVTIQKCRQ